MAKLVFTVLLASTAPACCEQFSIRCGNTGYYYFTFDTETRRVAFETAGGRLLKGGLITPQPFQFEVIEGGKPPFELRWDEQQLKLTWIGLPGDPTRPTSETICERVPLRGSLEKYDLIFPQNYAPH